jgi:hypothetical protein
MEQVEEHRSLLEGVRPVQHHHTFDASVVEGLVTASRTVAIRGSDIVDESTAMTPRTSTSGPTNELTGSRPWSTAIRSPGSRTLAIVPPVVSTTTDMGDSSKRRCELPAVYTTIGQAVRQIAVPLG